MQPRARPFTRLPTAGINQCPICAIPVHWMTLSHRRTRGGLSTCEVKSLLISSNYRLVSTIRVPSTHYAVSSTPIHAQRTLAAAFLWWQNAFKLQATVLCNTCRDNTFHWGNTRARHVTGYAFDHKRNEYCLTKVKILRRQWTTLPTTTYAVESCSKSSHQAVAHVRL